MPRWVTRRARCSSTAASSACSAERVPSPSDGVGVPRDTPVRGTENGTEFFRTLIKAEKDDLDLALACADVVGAAEDLVAAHPDVGAIVLECTNMPPYASAVRAATGRPVYDIHSLVTWFHAGLRPRRFDGGGP